MVHIIKRVFFQQWFPNWSPDSALRYLPIVRKIKKHHFKNILDVGSGGLGIGPYLKQPFTGLDVDFKSPISPYINKITGRITSIPFKDKSFEAVIAVDVLEHLPRKDRVKAIKELLRVAKNMVIIAVPAGKMASEEDSYINQYIVRDDIYLKEHLRYGLPEENKILAAIPKEFKVTIKNNVSLFLHRIILKKQFSDKRINRFISSVIFILLLSILTKINYLPVYRKIFIIERSSL